MKIRIAVVQFKTRELLPENNLEYAEKFIKTASKSRADLIVFPEVFLSRNCSLEKKFIISDKNCLSKIKELSKKYSISILAGSIIELYNGKKYNTTYYFDANGKVRGKYRKEHLWSTEKRLIKRGRHITIINTKHGRIGLIICWDLIFPEIFRALKKKGVELILCPANWSYQDAGEGLKYDKNSEVKAVNSLCVERAFEEEIILVFCNTAGKSLDGRNNSVGCSQITEPFKGVIKRLNHNKEEMFIQEIDTKILKDAEKAYEIRRDLFRK